MGVDKIKEDAEFVAGKVKEAVKQDPEKKKERVANQKQKALAKKKRKEIRKKRRAHGGVFTSKKKKKARMLAADNRRAADKTLARVASGDSVTGSDESVSMKYGKKMGGSMGAGTINNAMKSFSGEMGKGLARKLMGGSMKGNQSGGGYNAKNPAAAAKQLMRNQRDGGSMYGKEHGSSMNKYDKKMMHLREQISDDKKAIHRTDQAKKSHAHPIFKHMRKF